MITVSQNPQFLGSHPPALSLLPQWGLILIEGADAASFLQSQLSNSVLGLEAIKPPSIAHSHNSARLVGYCNPKGRLLASAWLGLFTPSDSSVNRYALFISRDIAASTAKRLAMYVLRSKVSVIDASANWVVLACYGSSAEIDAMQSREDQICLRMPDVLLDQQSYGRVLVAQANTHQNQNIQGDSAIWNYLEVMSAIPRIVSATQEQFVPQMINFESVAGIDFKKGCYPGQEIVARSQYRGVIKRRLQLAHIDVDTGAASIGPGTELFNTDEPDQPAGMVVLSASTPFNQGRIDFQIECKLGALETGEIHLGGVDGPVLKIDSLPYPLIEI